MNQMRELLSGGPDALPVWLQHILTRGLDQAGRSAPTWIPSLAAVAALVEQNSMLLTLERVDGRGLGLPGGMVHWRESVEEALRREVLEETGYHVEADRLFDVYSDPRCDDRLSAVLVVYGAHLAGGACRNGPEGKVKWLDLGLPIPPMAFQADRIIREYVRPGLCRRSLNHGQQ